MHRTLRRFQGHRRAGHILKFNFRAVPGHDVSAIEVVADARGTDAEDARDALLRTKANFEDVAPTGNFELGGRKIRTVWNDLPRKYLAHVQYFDDVMRALDETSPAFLPALTPADTLIVASDFTGAQPNSRFETFSFVIAPIEAIAQWNEYRKEFREHYGLANRRLAYAKLNDRRKRSALVAFLYLANAIAGLSVTILINKRTKSLFKQSELLTPADVEIGKKHFDRWKPRVSERVLRACHLVGVFVAGVSGPGQNVTWVTDEDDIAPNVEALTDLTYVFVHILGGMLPHNLGHIRVGTTGTTAGDDLAMEDFAAIPDLVAGAVNDFICGYGTDMRLSKLVITAPGTILPKTHNLIAALFDPRAPLRKLAFMIDQPDLSRGLQFTQLRIHLEPGVLTPVR
jgi:hypothetical protein